MKYKKSASFTIKKILLPLVMIGWVVNCSTFTHANNSLNIALTSLSTWAKIEEPVNTTSVSGEEYMIVPIEASDYTDFVFYEPTYVKPQGTYSINSNNADYLIVDDKISESNTYSTYDETNSNNLSDDESNSVVVQDTVFISNEVKIKNIADTSLKFEIANQSAVITNLPTKNTEHIFEDKIEANFPNGDYYEFTRLSFSENRDDRIEIGIPIEGRDMVIRFVDPTTKKWVSTEDISNIKDTTLFIETSTNSYIISVAGVYDSDLSNNTLTIMHDLETGVKIEDKDTYYNIIMSFPQNTDTISEYWYMSSNEKLVNWNNPSSFSEYGVHDLSIDRRWSYDGCYFLTPYNYVPSGKNIMYLQPSNYIGASFTNYGKNNLAKNFGYIMTYIYMENQNNMGFWETGPMSQWLYDDFGIGENFYDTRFNSDFGGSLLSAYVKYGNIDFLESALRYAQYFQHFVENNSFETENGGILVADYGQAASHEITHVSLNHHLSELNFLYQLYSVTQHREYLELAEKMLLGVVDTKYEWVLPDGNLVYALHYDKGTNLMVDYPYLTYNDLYKTNGYIEKLYGTSNDTIDFLMNSKKTWMDANGISGYLGYTS